MRQVNRVRRTEVISSFDQRWPEGADADDAGAPFIVYDLGPDIPIPEISTRGTYATGRVWTLLDQLLVHDTLADAVRASRDLTTRR